MSALARYFLHEGKQVAGYDRTASELTRALECEGATVTYEDEADTIPSRFGTRPIRWWFIRRRSRPIVCSSGFFRDGGFEIVKRSRMLGVMAEGNT
ncbi:MAG: Mur ligase domain-containing protein [Alistipes sp.]